MDETVRALLGHVHSNADLLTSHKILKHLFFVDSHVFVLSASYDVMPAFYTGRHMNNQLNTRLEFANIGKTSFQFHTSIRSAQTGQVLHKAVAHLVVVDKESRRPTPLPGYFLDHFQGTATKVPVEKVTSLIKPDHSTVVHYTVRWSDTDSYLHINQGNYVRICFDAMVEVSRQAKFKSLAGDLAQYWVKHFNCLYLNEASPGDILDVYSWEDENYPMNVHARAERRGQAIFQCSFWFTQPVATKL